VTIEKVLGIGNIADAENWELKHYVETAIRRTRSNKRTWSTGEDGEVIIVEPSPGG